jgi:hypothetical protein
MEKVCISFKLIKVEGRLNILDYSDTKEFPVLIEFFEAGGPVASGYKYLTQIKLFSRADKVFLNYKEVRDFVNPKPRLVVSNEKELSLDTYKEILTDLINYNIKNLNYSFITENSSNEKPNFFSFSLGEIVKVRFDYSISHKDTPEFEPFENIIQLMKNLLFSNLR